MASVFFLLQDTYNIEDQVVQNIIQNFGEAVRKYKAATTIQSVWRGYVVRKYIKSLHDAATIIQKHYRGWYQRYILVDKLQYKYDLLCIEQYNHYASKIQQCWRKYRRKGLSYFDDEDKNTARLALNIDFMEFIRKQIETNNDPSSLANQKKYAEKVLKILFNRHHLLRTEKRPGILSDSGKELSFLEKLLDAFPWKEYMDRQRKMKKLSLQTDPEIPEPPYLSNKKFSKAVSFLKMCSAPDDPLEIPEEEPYVKHPKPFVLTSRIDRNESALKLKPNSYLEEARAKHSRREILQCPPPPKPNKEEEEFKEYCLQQCHLHHIKTIYRLK